MPSGLKRQDIGRRGRRRHHRHLAGMTCELAQNVALDAVIDGDDVEFRVLLAAVAFVPLPRRLFPDKALPRRHHRHEIHADETGPGFGVALERLDVEVSGRLVRDHGIRHAVLANERRQRAGVDAGKADDAAAFQPGIEIARRPIIRRLGDRGMQHDAAGARRRREIDGFDVLVIRSDIADMRKREGDDLPRIGRIGEDLLIAGHRGIEADLADRVPGRAEAGAFQHGAVREHQ